MAGYTLLNISCFLQFAIREVALIPPGLAETADERFLEELVEWKGETTAEFNTTAADIPTVVVHAYSAGYVLQADRIEMAGDGFLEFGAAFSIGSVEYTIASTIGIMIGKYAVTIVHNAGDQFA